MTDPLDRDITTGLHPSGGTVALHDATGMIGSAHCAGMLMDVGTPSHAFQQAEEWRLLRGAMLLVHITEPNDDHLIFDASIPAGTTITAARYQTEPSVTRGASSGEGGNGGGTARGPDAGAMARIAELSAARQVAVAVHRPAIPQLGDNPVDNIRNLFGITYADVGRLFGISERHAHRWQSRGVPAERRHDTDAMQAIGMTIIGGLGPAGARAWLRSGEPSGEALARKGRYAELAARAQAEKDIPFT